jgi:DNA repair protein RecN (Recombination protein N)
VLHELRVENLGIIPELNLVLGGGLTAITGETGAGKTLIVEALQLLLGERADAALVRAGATEARVEGRFVVGDEEHVLTRVVPADGRSRAYVDGRLATAAELSELGARFVDLHGQHDHQSLLLPAQQRRLLDSFAGPAAADALVRLRAARAEIARVDEALAALGGDERTRAREIDLLRYQLDEIAAAAVRDAKEDDDLRAREALLADAEAHREALGTAHEQLSGGAADAIGEAVGALTGRAPFGELETRARALQADCIDLAHELRVARDGMVSDPETLDAVRARRAQLRELRRKYGDTLADVLGFAQDSQARLAELEGHAARVAELEATRGAAQRDARAAAAALHEIRTEAAPRLAGAVTIHLADLALAKARFDVEIDLLDADDSGDDGADRVTFVLAPNAGEAARPLARAASGGELSRTMLAIRLVLSEAPPTLVFDEVDAGIGGEAGVAIGRALRQLGEHHQVLCVTHLAQVAAAAHTQVHVSKQEARGRTQAEVTLLLDDSRVGELARMLGGDAASASARAHAQELLDGAAASNGRSVSRKARSRAR